MSLTPDALVVRRIQRSNSARPEPRRTLELNKYPDVASHVCISRVCFVAAAASGRLVPAVGAVMRPEDVGLTHHAGGKFLSPSRDPR